MSERTRLVFEWLLAIAIAIALWYTTALEDREPESEKTVEASVSYNNKPEELLIVNRIPEVSVRLRGRQRDIRRLRQREVDVEVDLSELTAADSGPFTYNLDADEVFLPYEGLEVVSVEPSFITLQLEAKVQRRLPIRVALAGEPAAGAIVVAREATPNTALVEGPRSHIESLRDIQTAPVALDGHALTFQEQVPLTDSDSLIRIIQPSIVTVRVLMSVPGTTVNGGAPPS